MRILMLTRFYLNGQTTHILSLSKHLRKRGHFVYLIASYLDNYAYIQWLTNQGIPFSRSNNFSRLGNLLKQYNFDLIHTHSAHTLEPAIFLGKQWGIPVIATCHYREFKPISFLREVAHVIFISPEMPDLFHLPNSHYTVIENGVDTDELKPGRRHPSAFNVTFLARMTESKQPGYENFAKLALNNNWNITSVGNWQPVIPKIKVLKWQINIAPILKTTTLVVGTGRAIREGMACGCLAFVLGEYTDGLVTPENIHALRATNFSGRATSQQPTEQVLTKQLQEVTENRWRELTKFNRQYALKHFSHKKMMNDTLQVYSKVLKQQISSDSLTM